MTISELLPNQTNCKLTLLLKRVAVGMTNTNNPYLNLFLVDKTGSISARLWDAKPADIESLAVGTVLNINANSILYSNELQLKINNYSLVTDEEVKKSLLIKAPIDVENSFNEIIDTINNFQDQTLKAILTYLLTKQKTDFNERPAAIKMHHSVRSGLLWHTITMLKTAKAIVSIYHDRLINSELLYAGIIMHDFGKIWELSADFVSKFTNQGQFMGHIVIGSEKINEACIALKIDPKLEIVTLLQHLILASHGKFEYGSPVLPKVIEAEILHQVDNLDAKISIIDEELKKTKPKELTSRIAGIDGRNFYHHNIK